MPSLREAASSATAPTAPIEKLSSWNTTRSSKGARLFRETPNASELYKRLLGPTESGAQMPFGQPPLPPQSIEAIRRWIVAGAPDWATIPTTNSRFISPGEILKSIETHLTSLEPFDRAFARYFTLTHLHNAGETPEILGEYRKALSINWSTASHGELVSSTHSPLTRKLPSSTSTCDTTSGIALTPGRR